MKSKRRGMNSVTQPNNKPKFSSGVIAAFNLGCRLDAQAGLTCR
jgi:hypothetical protein